MKQVTCDMNTCATLHSEVHINLNFVCVQNANIWWCKRFVFTSRQWCLLCKRASVRLQAPLILGEHRWLLSWGTTGRSTTVYLQPECHNSLVTRVAMLSALALLYERSSGHISCIRTSRPGSVCSTSLSLSCSTRTWSSCLPNHTPPAPASALTWVPSPLVCLFITLLEKAHRFKIKMSMLLEPLPPFHSSQGSRDDLISNSSTDSRRISTALERDHSQFCKYCTTSMTSSCLCIPHYHHCGFSQHNGYKAVFMFCNTVWSINGINGLKAELHARHVPLRVCCVYGLILGYGSSAL